MVPVTPAAVALSADWGFDALWCSAAADYGSRVLGWRTNRDRTRSCAVLTSGPPVKHLHQSWTTVFEAKGRVRGRGAKGGVGGRMPQSYFDALSVKLQLNSRLVLALRELFPQWYRSGDDAEASPHHRDENGVLVWESVTKWPASCSPRT